MNDSLSCVKVANSRYMVELVWKGVEKTDEV